MKEEIKNLLALEQDIGLLSHISALLAWDQETYMPPKAVDERGQQLALIESLILERMSNPKIGLLLESLGSTSQQMLGDPDIIRDEVDRSYLRALRRNYDMATKLPASLVIELAKTTSIAHSVWIEARAKNDYELFAPYLQKILDLSRAKAACLNPDISAYDVLLDLYEPDCTEANLSSLFILLQNELSTILDAVRGKPAIANDFLKNPCPAHQQKKVSTWLMEVLGYEKNRGRIDRVEHPFMTRLGVNDVRITTKYHENNFTSSIFSTIHETGHALYEMGLNPGSRFKLSSLWQASSTAIHESQSRLWENIIGRSKEFWQVKYGKLQELVFPTLDKIPLDSFVKAINKVEPSHIRIEADELTYSLHIILRFRLEAQLMAGKLLVADLPAAWNEESHKLLGIIPPNNAQGCLQDVHWAAGYFGYFPSYALGNLYAAQFWSVIEKSIGENPWNVIKENKQDTILAWLRSHIHSKAASTTPSELIQSVSGKELSSTCFVKYLKAKYSKLYKI